jgi:hypothetical protein
MVFGQIFGCGHQLNELLISRTSNTSGICFLMIVSTPFLRVIWLTLHSTQFPWSRTVTRPSWSTSTRLMSPPSERRKGRTSSSACSIRSFQSVLIPSFRICTCATGHRRDPHHLCWRKRIIPLHQLFHYAPGHLPENLTHLRLVLKGCRTAHIS